MTKLTIEERINKKIKQLEAKIQKRAAKKEETRKMHKEIYRLWCENGGDTNKVALKVNYSKETIKNIIYNIKKTLR
jgi:DNA-binding NarL/FixJ family response regulator